MKNIALQKIKDMKSYNPPLSGRRGFRGLPLDFNERTVPPSSKIQKALENILKSNKLQFYPEYEDLEKKLAEYAGVKTDQIMITNGSDQAIDLVFRTFTETGNTVIIPTPSFAMFYQSAQIAGNKILRPLYAKENLSFPLKELLDMVNDSVRLIVICNPNNPTGTIVPIDDIETVAKRAPNTIILVDEAYFEFSRITAVPLIKRYPNIVVARTLSKAFGLASLRVGYLVASKNYITEFLKVRGPYDVNMLAIIASSTALDNIKNVEKYANEIMNIAKPMVEEFFTKNGIIFYKSSGNFLLYKPLLKQENELLKENGILTRFQNNTNIENTIRLSIGTVKQMKQFIKVYKKAVLNSLIKKYAFLDRDGTLIFEPQDTYQIDSVKKLKILNGVLKGLKQLQKLGYELIMVTNQDGLGTPSFSKESFDKPQNKLLDIFKKNGVAFREIFVCPDSPERNCGCRKPKTGLVKKLLQNNRMDKKQSFVCGDRNTDKLFAKNLGIKFVSIQTNEDFYNALKKGGII